MGILRVSFIILMVILVGQDVYGNYNLQSSTVYSSASGKLGYQGNVFVADAHVKAVNQVMSAKMGISNSFTKAYDVQERRITVDDTNQSQELVKVRRQTRPVTGPLFSDMVSRLN
ncbi:MAG: hypothetical protein CL521_05485 [Actinobacteria bacterium]|nr:hypothetical protein [Actinomycetota bacterium]